jgi:hypothetical protein
VASETIDEVLGSTYLQFGIWGYALDGDVLEFSACVAESRDHVVSRKPAWDRTSDDIAGEWISRATSGYRRVKDWAALPWVSEHAMRGHVEWPGL